MQQDGAVISMRGSVAGGPGHLAALQSGQHVWRCWFCSTNLRRCGSTQQLAAVAGLRENATRGPALAPGCILGGLEDMQASCWFRGIKWRHD